MAFLNNIDIVNGHRFSERKVMLYQLYVLYDTITVGYWKAISVKNCIFNRGQIDIFVFITLNSKYNLVCLFRVLVFHISIESLWMIDKYAFNIL